jgi:hypothetical protein
MFTSFRAMLAASNAASLPATVSNTDSSFDGASGGDTASFSFTTQSFGAADATRRIIVCPSGRRTGGTNPNGGVASMTIGGVSATEVTSVTNAGNHMAMWIAAVPSGTTGTVAITWTNTQNKCAIGVFSLLNSTSSAIASATSISSPLSSGSLSIPENGCAVGAGYSGINTTTTWANLSEDFDANDAGESWTWTGASKDVTTTENPTITATFGSSDRPGGVFASFGPV